MKKTNVLAILLGTLMIAGTMAACSASADTQTETTAAAAQTEATDETAQSTQTLVGRVTAIDGNTVTLLLGELTEQTPGAQRPDLSDADRPALPDGEVPELPEGEAPELPEGETPELPEGEAPELPEGEAPELPEGEAPELPEGTMENASNGARPDRPDGQAGGRRSMQRFTEGTETRTITLTQSQIEDLKQDDVVRITLASDGSAETVETIRMPGMDGGFGQKPQTKADATAESAA